MAQCAYIVLLPEFNELQDSFSLTVFFFCFQILLLLFAIKDVLVNEQKIAGILIESSNNGWFLIGIGVNLAYAPPVPTTGTNYGRTSTSISSFCAPPASSNSNWDVSAQKLGVHLADDLHSFLMIEDPTFLLPSKIINEWKGWADLDMELVMRDTPNKERVKVVDMLPDGRIRVVGQDDGVHRTLVSDYFL
jgi:biotin-(acetyl-CoA carboxylase) ligase